MEISDYMKHAQQWKKARDERASQEAEEQARKIRAEWERIDNAIRRALPVDGIELSPVNFRKTEMPIYSSNIEIWVKLPTEKPGLLRALVRYEQDWQVFNWAVPRHPGKLEDWMVCEGPEDAVLQSSTLGVRAE